MLFKLSKILMAPVNDKGSGSGKKKPDDNDDGDGEGEDTPLTREDVTRMVNGAVTGMFNKTKFKEMLGTAVKETVSPLFEDLKTSLSGKKTDDDDGDNGGDDKGKKQASGITPEVQKRLDELERSNKQLLKETKEEKEKAAAADKRNDEQEERSKLAVALKAAGVSEDRLPGALALLYLEQKKIVRDENRKIKFVVQKEDYEEKLDLEKGVADWIKSPEGKSYLPPKEIAGAGTRGGPPPVRRGEEPSEAQLMHQLGSAMMGVKVDLG